MPLRLIAASLIALAFHTTAVAQRADLMQFDGAGPSDFVIRVGPVPVPADRPQADQVPDLAAMLAADFAGMVPKGAIDTTTSSARLEVPRWMRTGVVASSTKSPAIASQSPGFGCGDIRYRPRRDLPAATELRRAKHFPLIATIACEENVPIGLFDALIWQESRYQAFARSPKGAIGLAQLMPGTAQYLGVSDPWDVSQNLRGGARYLRMQIEEFGRYDLALAAYNAGPGRVRSTRAIPTIRETREYVQQITAAWGRGR